MLIVRDSQVKKLFYKEQEIDKILDWNGNVVFEKESSPTMTNIIKFHTTSAVSGYKYFTISYTDSTYNVIDYSEPNKQYTAQIPTDKTVNALDFDSSLVDEVIVSCKINLSDTFFSTITPNTIRFLNCDATASTNLSNLFTSRSKSVKLFEIRNLDARNATSMVRMFADSEYIETIVMNGVDVRNVTNMSWMFKNCSGATTIDIANWNTSSVTDLSNVFDSCKNVSYIDLSSWDTSNATTMYEMFQDCTSLVMLDLSAFNTSKVTEFRYMFWQCNKLTSLDISGWNITNAKDNTNCMFCGCNSLKTIKMIGCNQATIDKIKAQLKSDGILNQVTIIT